MSLQDSLRIVAKNYDKSRPSQALEISRLGLGPDCLAAKEYYGFRQFDDARLSFLEKPRNLGPAHQEHVKKFLNNYIWRILADDKFIFDTLLRPQGFPLAKILATYKYRPNLRACSVPSVKKTDDLKSFLRNGVHYPFSGKPIKCIMWELLAKTFSG